METGQIIDNKYQIEKRIGRGAYSIWYLSKPLNEDGKTAEDIPEVVLKISNKPEFSFFKDYTISWDLSAFPQLLQYKEYGRHEIFNHTTQEGKGYDYLVSDYMANGTLFDYVIKEGFDESWARYLFKKVLQGIESMHENWYVHLDIKLGNILIDSNFSPKLWDLGFAQRADKDHIFEWCDFKYKGTKYYVCPEIHSEDTFNGFAADIFSIGVWFFILLVGDYPFLYAKKTDNKYQNFYKKNPFLFWKKHSKAKKKINKGIISDDFVDLITRMLIPSKLDRITMEEIKEHSWYKDSTMEPSTVKDYMEIIRVKKGSK